MSKVKKKTCIVHYHGLNSYSEIKSVSSASGNRIRAAKVKREELKGENYHQMQCGSIPKTINDDHGMHMTPCYKKFTLILSSRYDDKDSEETRSSKRNSSSNIVAWVYPNTCGICKKRIIKYQGRKVVPKTIATNEASDTIKEAAKTKDFELYAEIKDLNLIAKEFKYHEHCRKNFTRKRKHGETASIKFMVLS